jgi:hypothetical protein
MTPWCSRRGTAWPPIAPSEMSTAHESPSTRCPSNSVERKTVVLCMSRKRCPICRRDLSVSGERPVRATSRSTICPSAASRFQVQVIALSRLASRVENRALLCDVWGDVCALHRRHFFRWTNHETHHHGGYLVGVCHDAVVGRQCSIGRRFGRWRQIRWGIERRQ